MASSINQKVGSQSNRNSKKYPCKNCMREFNSLSNLSVHRELHYRKPRECSKCGKKYERYSALYMHYKTHNLIHECKICGCKFSRPYLLKRHVKCHKGVFSCTRCRSLFIDRHSLIEHRKTAHNKEKLFKCDKCPRSYTLNSALKRHMMKEHEPDNKVRSVPQLGEPSTSS